MDRKQMNISRIYQGSTYLLLSILFYIFMFSDYLDLFLTHKKQMTFLQFVTSRTFRTWIREIYLETNYIGLHDTVIFWILTLCIIGSIILIIIGIYEEPDLIMVEVS